MNDIVSLVEQGNVATHNKENLPEIAEEKVFTNTVNSDVSTVMKHVFTGQCVFNNCTINVLQKNMYEAYIN